MRGKPDIGIVLVPSERDGPFIFLTCLQFRSFIYKKSILDCNIYYSLSV